RPWSAAEIAALLDSPGTLALQMSEDRKGFVMVRALAGEAEILTLAVAPEGRRQGQARALMQAAIVQALARQAETLFLEVAADNAAALGLYEGLGFEMAGRRKGYYDRGAASPRIDALVMRLCLNR
ncbi:MAG: GNAT family N-acetyltransferase, partial [Caulobacteraceae bacterium]|nr:GNAT family N-acetyltransferase [Caulobacteraceae bacterium]